MKVAVAKLENFTSLGTDGNGTPSRIDRRIGVNVIYYNSIIGPASRNNPNPGIARRRVPRAGSRVHDGNIRIATEATKLEGVTADRQRAIPDREHRRRAPDDARNVGDDDCVCSSIIAAYAGQQKRRVGLGRQWASVSEPEVKERGCSSRHDRQRLRAPRCRKPTLRLRHDLRRSTCGLNGVAWPSRSKAANPRRGTPLFTDMKKPPA